MTTAIKIKLLHEQAKIPTKAHDFDAGFDLYSVQEQNIWRKEIFPIHTGIALEIPRYCVGIIKDRSSMARNGIHVVGGIIDCGYTGEIVVLVARLGYPQKEKTAHEPAIKIGDKVAQLIILPLGVNKAEFHLVDELSETSRGEKGFGSSDHCQLSVNDCADEIYRTAISRDDMENH